MAQALSINQQMKPILLGSDPELFLADESNKLVSAIGKFPGDKYAPHSLPQLGKGYAIQVDNVLVEYNIPPVAKRRQWEEAHKKMLDYITAESAKQGLHPVIAASAIMPESELEHPMARVFGCEPDFNAWEKELNPAPGAIDPNLRSAGGHIHIGIELSDIQKINFVRFLDLVIGSISILKDPDTRRAELYGRPGAMRFKPYGVEYRTVSNFWLGDENSRNEIFRYVMYCAQYHTYKSYENRKADVYKMFSTRDPKLAKGFLQEFASAGVMGALGNAWE